MGRETECGFLVIKGENEVERGEQSYNWISKMRRGIQTFTHFLSRKWAVMHTILSSEKKSIYIYSSKIDRFSRIL